MGSLLAWPAQARRWRDRVKRSLRPESARCAWRTAPYLNSVALW